jgi:hypothetical protein
MTLSEDMQRRKAAFVKTPISLEICAHHGTHATLQDQIGMRWCELCKPRHDLMNWGFSHKWPAVYVHPYAIGNDEWLWKTAVLWGRNEAVATLLEGLQGIQQSDDV